MDWVVETFVEDAELYVSDLTRRVEGTPAQVADLLSLLAAHDQFPERALDVACGIGRHSIALAHHGIEAHGFDVSPTYVEWARDDAAAAGVADRTKFFVHDMRSVGELSGSYDLVTSLYNSFGYYDDETNERVLRGFAERLAPDGTLVLLVANKEAVLDSFETEAVHRVDEQLWLDDRRYDPHTSRLHTTHRVYDGESSEFLGQLVTDLRLYAPVELRRLLERVGFEVELYASLTGDALTRTSTRLVACCRTPESNAG